VLAVFHAQFEVDWLRPEWIEDELVRSGAREAHMLADDVPIVAVTVWARSAHEANSTSAACSRASAPTGSRSSSRAF
jgi:hypothetical protein